MSDTELAQKLENTKIADQQDAASKDDDFDLSMMKKKKKTKSKKINLDELDAENDAAAADTKGDAEAEAEGEDAFADLKKKKKKSKSKTVSFDEEDGAAGEGEGDDDVADISLMKKKKKSKKAKSLAAFEAELGGEEDQQAESPSTDKASEPWIGTDRDYTYQELLGRFYNILRDNNPDSVGIKGKYVMVPPHITRDGKKRTAFTNIDDIAKKMHRTPEHLIKYLYSELATTGSVDANKHLIIKGRFQQKQIENVLRRYIVEYVTCKTCKSGDTRLVKENSLNFVKCESCGSSRSVTGITKGFQAAAQGKRRADRMAANA
ncbi:translation initiation factor eIF-2 beta subunit [Coemansia erecta]|uniref:Translation initiation factor eIF-2 beta subunit n=1 Tax=Coemansia erecta TaxID=147472 RepID=A0A9W8CP36_9FUNG|nr:translation initiation factor eIF-2 beta subunit [Coemansia erecta]